MNDASAKVQRLLVRIDAKGAAVVHCPRRDADVDMAECNVCARCVGLSLRDSYLVCTWNEGGDVMKNKASEHAGLQHTSASEQASPTNLGSAVYAAFALSRFEKSVVTVSLDDTVLHAARLMRTHKLGCVVVVREGRPVGMLTDRDIVLRVVAGGLDPAATVVSSVVTYDVVTIARTDGFETAVRAMRQHGVRRVPIIDGDGRLTGMVTADDLVALLGSELSALGETINSNVDGSESR